MDNYVLDSNFSFKVPSKRDIFYLSGLNEQILDFVYEDSKLGNNNNIMLIGPHGCGKSETVQQYAALRNLKFYETNCSLYREPRDFFGFKGAANGNTYMRKANLIKALQTENTVVLLDEINRVVSPSISNSLLSLLDDRRYAYFDEIGEINVAKGVTVFATKNLGLQYTGTVPSDRSLSDRFQITLEVTYLPPEKEVDVLVVRTGIDKENAELLVKFASTVRDKASELGSALRETISTRTLLGCAKLFSKIGKAAIDVTVLPLYSKEGGSNSERTQVQIIKQIVFGD
jgi:MoxR-like ATPase